MNQKPMTVKQLISELQQVKDKSKVVNVHNHEGDLTSNIDLFDEKWCVILEGRKPFRDIYKERSKEMGNTDYIGDVFARWISEKDQKLEVKVRILNFQHQEVNLRIDQQELIDAGAIQQNGSVKKAGKWLNNNKTFVLNQINKQFPTFWVVE